MSATTFGAGTAVKTAVPGRVAATASGSKYTLFVDADGDRTRDAGEKSFGTARVYEDLNDNGILDAGELSFDVKKGIFATAGGTGPIDLSSLRRVP